MYLIRKATPTDVEAIRHIATVTFWHTYSPIVPDGQVDYMLENIYSAERISAQLAGYEQTYLLLLEDGQPVAFANYSPRQENAAIYKLHKLYCLPQTQGKGYGKILINEVARQTRELGIHTLDLNVNRYNKAKTFYEKMGFAVAYEEDIAIGPYFMNDFVMRLLL